MKNLIYCGMLIVHYLVLFVDNSISGIPTTANVIVKQCVEDGGYCQNHWDCCSNSCLSFSYKCVRRPTGSLSSVYVQSANKEDPTLISVASIDDLVNRFGSIDDKPVATAAAPSTIPTTSASTSTSTSTSSSTINTTSSQCVGIGYECTDSSQCCSDDCLHYQDVHICIAKRRPTTTVPNAECLLIGQKCYRHEECCTQRCHGFLHQCVT